MVFYVEKYRNGLDRRVFRRMDNGALEWAHYGDWMRDPMRARFYGSVLRDVPQEAEEIFDDYHA